MISMNRLKCLETLGILEKKKKLQTFFMKTTNGSMGKVQKKTVVAVFSLYSMRRNTKVNVVLIKNPLHCYNIT